MTTDPAAFLVLWRSDRASARATLARIPVRERLPLAVGLAALLPSGDPMNSHVKWLDAFDRPELPPELARWHWTSDGLRHTRQPIAIGAFGPAAIALARPWRSTKTVPAHLGLLPAGNVTKGGSHMCTGADDATPHV